MKYRQLGKTGWNVSAIGYGGVVSSQHFDKAVIPGDGQKMSDEYVSWAVEHGMGERIRRAVKDKGLGLLGIKSMVDRAWSHEEQDSSKYIKSWCRPFDIETESSYLTAALKYSISLGADILIPPGNFEHLKYAVCHIDEVLDNPLTEEDRAFLAARLPQVQEQPFYDPECYQF